MTRPADELFKEFSTARDAAVQAHKCILCDQPFTAANVFTDAGWREVRLSGMCEECFDREFADEEETGLT